MKQPRNWKSYSFFTTISLEKESELEARSTAPSLESFVTPHTEDTQ